MTGNRRATALAISKTKGRSKAVGAGCGTGTLLALISGHFPPDSMWHQILSLAAPSSAVLISSVWEKAIDGAGSIYLYLKLGVLLGFAKREHHKNTATNCSEKTLKAGEEIIEELRSKRLTIINRAGNIE